MKANTSLHMIVIVMVIISSLGIFGLLFIQSKMLGMVNKVPQDVIVCQESAFLAARVTNPVTDKNFVSYQCPVGNGTVTKEDINKPLSPQEEQEFVDLGYTSQASYHLDDWYWKQTDLCYKKVLYGRNPLFGKNFNYWMEDQFYCVICSVHTIEPEVQAQGAQNARAMFNTRTVQDTTLTMPLWMGQVQQNQIGYPKTTYSLSDQVAFIYRRANSGLFEDYITTPIVNLLPGEDIASLQFEYLQMVPYNHPRDLEPYCTYYVNSFED